MAVSIIRLDRRYAGGNDFDYCLEFYRPHKDGEEFCDIRNWCWETFGPGRELKFCQPHINYPWAFITDNHRTRIYLRSKKEVEWFTLRWSECIYRKN